MDCITCLISIITCSWVDLLEEEEYLSLQNLNPSSCENQTNLCKTLIFVFSCISQREEEELYVSRFRFMYNLFGFYLYNKAKMFYFRTLGIYSAKQTVP